MLLILIDTFILAVVCLAIIFSLKKYITLSRTEKLEAALAEQEASAKRAALAAKINPEEINNNNAKVQDVLSKIQE